MDLLWVEDSIEEWEQLIHESRHSYYPVCGETVVFKYKDNRSKLVDDLLQNYKVKPKR